jgi:hypothetical protein
MSMSEEIRHQPTEPKKNKIVNSTGNAIGFFQVLGKRFVKFIANFRCFCLL